MSKTMEKFDKEFPKDTVCSFDNEENLIQIGSLINRKKAKQFIKDNYIAKEEVERLVNNAELLNEVIKRGGIKYLDKFWKWDKKTPYGKSIKHK